MQNQWNETNTYGGKRTQREGRPFLIITIHEGVADYGRPGLVDLTSNTASVFKDRAELAKKLNEDGHEADPCDAQ
jgi:Fe-S cluster assembly ATPase SufC